VKQAKKEVILDEHLALKKQFTCMVVINQLIYDSILLQ